MDKNTLVILGNGFDLDLGLRTKYSDFWHAKEAIINNVRYVLKDNTKLIPPMVNYIPKYLSASWFDLEESFRWYASQTIQRDYDTPIDSISHLAGLHSENLTANIRYFDVVKRELIHYLSSQQKQKRLNKDSVAANFLKKLATYENNVIIYTFNYTDVNDFAAKLGIPHSFDVRYIHGNLKDKNIILGVGEDILYGGYDFLNKTNQGAKKNQFIEQLFNADEVICFGMAFGYNDIHYFRDYFGSISINTNNPRITIYTKDNKEFDFIVKRLKDNNVDINVLRNLAHLHFEPTMESK